MDATPALTRGIALLRLLENGEALSLEAVARQTGWPKSSLSRLLATLAELGLVARDSGHRTHRALMRLVPLAADSAAFERAQIGRAHV
jgi:DNA-binding IclR family transcriptional regulator